MESPWSLFLLFIPGVTTRMSACCFSAIGCITGVNRGVNSLRQPAKSNRKQTIHSDYILTRLIRAEKTAKQNDFFIERRIVISESTYLVAALFARRSRISSRTINEEKREIFLTSKTYHPNLLWHWYHEPYANSLVPMNVCKCRPKLGRTLPSTRKQFKRFIRWWQWYLRKSERPIRTVLRSMASGHVDIWVNRSFGDVKWFALNTHRTRRMCGFA